MRRQKPKEGGLVRSILGAIKRLAKRVGEEDIAITSSAVAFNVLLCMIPSLVVVTALVGIFLERSSANQGIDAIIGSIVPDGPYAAPIKAFITKLFGDIIHNRRRFGIAGLATLIWAASGLFASLRRVLNMVYRLEQGKMFLRKSVENILLVIFLGFLFLLANVLMWALHAANELFRDLFSDNAIDLRFMSKSFPLLVSYLSALLIFFIVNRFMPDKRIPSPVAWIASLTTTSLWWLAGKVFSWYVGTFHPFNQVYGTYAFIFIFLLWVYYSSAVFVIGVTAGQLYRERAARRAGTA